MNQELTFTDKFTYNYEKSRLDVIHEPRERVAGQGSPGVWAVPPSPADSTRVREILTNKSDEKLLK